MITKRISRINKLALEYFRQNLDASKVAQEYVYKRCSKQTSDIFKIGFAPRKKTGLVEYLNKHSDDNEAILASGLTFQDPDKFSYDFFYNRVIFPILHGTRIVGFGGRTITNAFPKYINTKKTPIYNKSRVLFGLRLTRTHICKSDTAFLVEGYFDTAVLYDRGIRNCCAGCGTAFTKEHAQLLARYAAKVYTMLDGDVPGQKAAKRAREHLKKLGIYGGNIKLPDGLDPEEFIVKYGKKKLLAKVK